MESASCSLMSQLEETSYDRTQYSSSSTTMKLTQKMVTTNRSGHRNIPLTKLKSFHTARETNTSASSGVRICSDCSTNTTPLWRSGPQGPKSLCNACGIRQRKARRSMAEAARAAGFGCGVATTTTSTTVEPSSVSKLEKKSLLNYNVRLSCKNKRKLIMADEAGTSSTTAPSKYHKRKDKQLAAFSPSLLFPLDVEEAAILLMGLSSGLSFSRV